MKTRRSSPPPTSNTVSIWRRRAGSSSPLLVPPFPRIRCLQSPKSEGAKTLLPISKTWSCSLPMQAQIKSSNNLSTCHLMAVLHSILKEELFQAVTQLPDQTAQLKKRENSPSNLHHNSLMEEPLKICNNPNSTLAQRASTVSSWLNSFTAPFPRLVMSTRTMRTSKRPSPATLTSLRSSSSASRPPSTRSNSRPCHRRTLASNMTRIYSKRVSNRS